MSEPTTRRTATFRWGFRVVTGAFAVVISALTALALSAWLAAALGVLVGFVVTFAWEWWDDQHAPDLVATFEEALE